MPEHGRAPFGRRVREALTAHLPYKLVALFLAIVLWGVVRFEEPSEGLVAVRLVAIADSGVMVAGPVPGVQAVVSGRGRDVLALYRHPPEVRHRVHGAAGDTVVVDLRARDVVMRPGIRAVVREVRPATVRVPLAARGGPARGREP